MIYLGADGTKARHVNKVQIHKDLVTIIQEVVEAPPLISGKVFFLRDGRGLRDLAPEAFKNVWPKACESLKLEEPHPRFHDLRHTWKTNARRSGMHPEIEMAIMGHSQRRRSVHERYGLVGDQELLDAIGRITFDRGETEIFVGGKLSRAISKDGDCVVTGTDGQRKRSRAVVT